jgi:pseudouridine kinase
VHVVDVTGAGDALSAGVCAALLRDCDDFDAAARLGLDLAALTLQTEDSVHPDLTPRFLEER